MSKSRQSQTFREGGGKQYFGEHKPYAFGKDEDSRKSHFPRRYDIKRNSGKIFTGLISLALILTILLVFLPTAALAIDYTFITIDVPGAPGTDVNGINDCGDIVGSYGDFISGTHGFLYSGGVFTTIDYLDNTWANGINDSGDIVGYATGPWYHNFLFSEDIFTIIDVPGATTNWGAKGINDFGDIVGSYGDATGRPGFLYSGGIFTPINFPGVVNWTVPKGINNSGDIVGTYTNSDEPGKYRGFLYSGAIFTPIDVPGATNGTDVNGINDFGDILGAYYDDAGSHGFLYSGGVFTPIDVPGALYGGVNGINNSGSIVGYYVDATPGRHSFMAAPVITVNPYSEEYVIMVGCAYDWPDRDDTSSGKLFYIPINPNGTFESVSEVADIGYRSGAGIADFDNDGDLDFVAGAREDDLAVANFYLFKNVGNGNFVKHLIAYDVPSNDKIGTFAVADFNKDGLKDFVVPMSGVGSYLFINNGNNTFTWSFLPPISDALEGKEGDFNEDGNMDFVITQYSSGSIYLYEGNGAGKFTHRLLFGIGPRAGDITVGDFNNDGHLDIIVDDCAPSGTGNAYLYIGDGNGNFPYPRSVVYTRPLFGIYYTYGVDSFDFDKDGNRDLILSTYEFGPAGWVFIMKGDGNGTFQSPVQIATGLGSIFPVTPAEIPEDVTPPVLTLPNDMTVECAGSQGTVVTFVTTAIDDIDGEVPVICTPASGSSFPLETTEVTCAASDIAGNTATGTFTVTINDTTGPAIQSLIATPDVLWPPNHKMVPVGLVVQASDTCDSNPICTITSVSSNEPVDGLGDGDKTPDWVTNNLTANLRSERSGIGSGRVYTISVQCIDAALNSSIGSVNVSVPFDLPE